MAGPAHLLLNALRRATCAGHANVAPLLRSRRAGACMLCTLRRDLSLSVRTKLLLVSVLLVAASVAAADVYLAAPVGDRLALVARADLLVRARLLSREVSTSPAPVDDSS